MIKEFEGKTEQEAIDRAVEELEIDRNEFDVEVVEETRGGLFRKGNVKIRIHLNDDEFEEVEEPEGETETTIAEFIVSVIEKMGFPGKVYIAGREERKVIFGIDSDHSNILIGKKGKNLDAIQMLSNVYAGRIGCNNRIIIDIEDYRGRREEKIIRLAKKVASQVRKSKSSRLMEPMNPFERRLIHTSLNEMDDIETKSEGEGLYKQVRIIYKGSSFLSIIHTTQQIFLFAAFFFSEIIQGYIKFQKCIEHYRNYSNINQYVVDNLLVFKIYFFPI